MTTEVADNTILSRILGNGDTSTFVPSTDGLHAAGVDIDALDARIPAALVSGRMDASVGAVANNAITAAAINTGAITSAKFAASAIDAAAIADGAIDAATFASGAIDATSIASGAITATKIATGAITAAKFFAGAIDAAAIADAAIDAATFAAGAIDAAAFAAGAITASAIAANAIGASELATDAVAEIVDAVWDEVLHTDHEVASSASVLMQSASAPTAAAVADAVWDEVLHTDHEVATSASVLLQAAGGAADPWATDLPGAYSGTTAGHIIGHIGAPAGASVSADIAAIAAAIHGVKKNTALGNFEFLMVDSTDGISAETGLTVSASRSIDGGAFGACANGVAEVGVGIYRISLAATDLNGDVITLRFTAAGALDRFITIKTST
jgi:hypothetical protein